ncbi:MAG TPA: DUF1080 domain-containing protein [Planctomycetaceae bacterium]|jgi:hypothetical protein|nr:DUF1080 domain-containing protein [Planctomycetaceae bacterium]
MLRLPRFERSFAGLLVLIVIPTFALGADTFLDPKDAGPDFAVQGEYLGTIGAKANVGAQVIALGGGRFDAVIYTKGLPGAGWDGKSKVRLHGDTQDGVAHLKGKNFDGTVKEGVFSGTAEDGVKFELKKVERTSPTLGATPPPGAIVLFDGKDTNTWQVGMFEEGNLLGVPAVTKQPFEDFLLHIEFRAPFMPRARGQGRGNSGVYLADQYEVQVLDSFGLEGLDNECGGIYKAAKPLVNMCFPPLAWQTYDIDFRTARFSPDGKTKKENASVTVRHNGVPIQYNLELKSATPGGHRSDEHSGPIFLQNHGNPVRFRNIWLVPR